MGKRWSQKEIDFLKKNYKTLTNKQFSKIFSRTKSSVGRLKSILKLKNKKSWNKDEIIKELNS